MFRGSLVKNNRVRLSDLIVHLSPKQNIFSLSSIAITTKYLFCRQGYISQRKIFDRLFFEAVFRKLGINAGPAPIFEIISVGGKGFFAPYKLILEASRVSYAIIADLDCVCDIGTPELKALFSVDAKKIKEDVVDNVGSLDGNALVARELCAEVGDGVKEVGTRSVLVGVFNASTFSH